MQITIKELASFIFRDGEKIPVEVRAASRGVEMHPAWERNTLIPTALAEQIIADPFHSDYFHLSQIDAHWWAVWHIADWRESNARYYAIKAADEKERVGKCVTVEVEKARLFRLDEMAFKITKRCPMMKKSDTLTLLQRILEVQGEAALAQHVGTLEQVLRQSFYIPPSVAEGGAETVNNAE